jgi:pimeloyl-ACP methyl ester carboxylesterase
MSAVGAIPTRFEPAAVPLWRESLFGVDWLSLRLSPVYYGVGVPRGDGAPVVLVPGFLGSDNYLVEMFHWLRRIGYTPFYSRIGRNSECPDLLLERFFGTIDEAYEQTGRKLHLVGHSLGGLIARSAAVQKPDKIAQVICLGSPFRDIRAHPMVLAAAGLVRGRIAGQRRGDEEVKRDCYTGSCTCVFASSARADLPGTVSRAAIYTPTDGVVDWRSCVEEDERLNIQVSGTHVGLVFNPQVYRHIARLLAGGRAIEPDSKRSQKPHRQ